MIGFSKIEKVVKRVLPVSVIITVLLFVIGGIWKPLVHSLLTITICLMVIMIILVIFRHGESKTISYKSLNGKDSIEIFDLSESEQTRRYIVNFFNSKYQLNLGDKQIEQIVTASYTSYYWAREVFDMSKDYAGVKSWISGETDWLRIYLYAFPSMNIISDFKAQYIYVFEEYKKIFDKLDGTKFLSMEEYLKEVNRRYFTSFDENMFVKVVHFMRENGYEFEYPIGIHIENESEEEKLMKKYD